MNRKRISALCAALLCAALSAQDIVAPTGGSIFGIQAPAPAPEQTDTPAAPDAAGDAKAAWAESVETGAAQPDAVQTAPAIPALAVPDSVPPAPQAPAPAGEMTRADSALDVYRSARGAIMEVNRKFPRPQRFRPGQATDTVREARAPDSALVSADETIKSAWAAMDGRPPLPPPLVQQPQQLPLPPPLVQQPQQLPLPLAQLPPPSPPSAVQPKAAETAAALPREPETPVAVKSAPPAKWLKGQAALGLLIPINFGGEPNFRPWWNMGYHAGYKEIDADAQFSGGLGVDLSLYAFSKEKYKEYYDSERNNLLVFEPAPMLIVDVGYYLKFYPVSDIKIPYVSGAVGICGAFGGGVKVSYNGMNKMEDNLIEDIYVSNIALGVGADYPVYAGIRAFADIHYSLRLGLYSMFNKDAQYIGGLVPQMPIKFGVMAPFKSIAEIFSNL